MESKVSLWWVRHADLRLEDNPALRTAVAARDHLLLPVYIHCPEEEGGYGPLPGSAAAVWFEQALRGLAASLKEKYNARLLVLDAREGGTLQAFHQLLDVLGSPEGIVAFNAASYKPVRARDQRVLAGLASRRVRGVTHEAGNFLYALSEMAEAVTYSRERNEWFGHYMTLMSVLKPCTKMLGLPPRPRDAPPAEEVHLWPLADAIECMAKDISNLGLADMPKRKNGHIVDWATPMLGAWGGTDEAAAHRALDHFMSTGLAYFEKARGRADKPDNNSRLSPYIRFGQLSPRRVYWAAVDSAQTNAKLKSATFERRVFWRDLSNLQLFLFPRMGEQKSIRPHYDTQLWNPEQERIIAAWRKGQTGFPIVDAAMRELYATGWMQTNVRMAAASFLCEYANCDWRAGESWFAQTLVDADFAINNMMWQNGGRCGFDQWNFKVSPATSWKSSDPTGVYIKRWVPELRHVPEGVLGTPWKMSLAQRKLAQVTLGETYPYPVIDPEKLSEAAAATRRAVQEMRAAHLDRNDAGGYDLIQAHDGTTTRLFTRKDLRLDRSGKPIDLENCTAAAAARYRRQKAAGLEQPGKGGAGRKRRTHKGGRGKPRGK